jgi:hypothetical protein
LELIVKRTVSIDAEIDKRIREIYKNLIAKGVRANYSSALNLLLLAGILETQGEGWSQDTRDLIKEYTSKSRSLSEILKRDVNLRKFRADIP